MCYLGELITASKKRKQLGVRMSSREVYVTKSIQKMRGGGFSLKGHYSCEASRWVSFFFFISLLFLKTMMTVWLFIYFIYFNLWFFFLSPTPSYIDVVVLVLVHFVVMFFFLYYCSSPSIFFLFVFLIYFFIYIYIRDSSIYIHTVY